MEHGGEHTYRHKASKRERRVDDYKEKNKHANTKLYTNTLLNFYYLTEELRAAPLIAGSSRGWRLLRRFEPYVFVCGELCALCALLGIGCSSCCFLGRLARGNTTTGRRGRRERRLQPPSTAYLLAFTFVSQKAKISRAPSKFMHVRIHQQQAHAFIHSFSTWLTNCAENSVKCEKERYVWKFWAKKFAIPVNRRRLQSLCDVDNIRCFACSSIACSICSIGMHVWTSVTELLTLRVHTASKTLLLFFFHGHRIVGCYYFFTLSPSTTSFDCADV